MATLVEVDITCKRCKTLHALHVDHAGLYKWHVEKEPIQRVLPTLSADDRELLISSICGKCWDEIFKDEE